MLPKSQWDHKYFTPVGDDIGGNSVVKAFIYNPGENNITVKESKGKSTEESCCQDGDTEFNVPSKESVAHSLYGYNGDMTGYELYTDSDTDVFFGVVVVDTSDKFEWQAFDWGHSLIPESQLSSQVIIGDGRRCAGEDQTRTNCDEYGINYVWITPVANAKIWVSLNGETNYTEYNAKRLSSLRLGDEDTDLSGAYIFATEPNAQSDGPPVDFAAVWGQESYKESDGSTAQSVQLDMVRGMGNVFSFLFASFILFFNISIVSLLTSIRYLFHQCHR